jgi:hypothetical protein
MSSLLSILDPDPLPTLFYRSRTSGDRPFFRFGDILRFLSGSSFALSARPTRA